MKNIKSYISVKHTFPKNKTLIFFRVSNFIFICFSCARNFDFSVFARKIADENQSMNL